MSVDFHEDAFKDLPGLDAKYAMKQAGEITDGLSVIANSSSPRIVFARFVHMGPTGNDGLVVDNADWLASVATKDYQKWISLQYAAA